MSNILNIPSKNSYLTSKQWEEVIKYVKNRKNITENIIDEKYDNEINDTSNEVIVGQHSEAYEILIKETSVSNMYMALLTIMNEEPEKLFEITQDELGILYATVNQMNEDNPSDDYVDLVDTLQYLAGEYDLNGAVAYAVWNGTSASGTYTISGTITMSSAVNIGSGKTLTLTGSGVIKRGSGNGYFYVQDGGTLIIKGDSKNSNIVIDGGSINSSNAAIRNHRNLTLENVTIKNCIRTSGMGGAIQFGYDGYTKTVSSSLTNCTIDRCKAPEGSAIMLHNACGGTITIKNSIVQNCESTGTYGGTIRTQGSFNGKVTIESCDIINNISNRHGGGVYWNARGTNAALTILGTTDAPTIIRGNSAVERGGGVYLGGQSINITHTHIDNNMSHVGGGICMSPYDYSTTTGKGCTLTLGNGAKILNNTATEYGGGVYMDIYSGSASMGENFTVIVDGDAVIQGNTAEYGGAFAVTQELGGAENSANNDKKYNAYVKINGGTIGGMYESEMNKSNIDGGAFYINRTYGNAGNDYELNVDITGGSILGNKANRNGGAIYLSDNSTNGNAEVDISGGRIGSSEATAANIAIDGGAIYVNNGNIFVSGGVIEYNKATHNGGAAYVADGNFIMNNGKLDNNISEDSGGAVYVTNGNADIESGVISNNIALNSGGAIAVTSGNVTIGTQECYNTGATSTHTHPIIESNIASDGGGVYVDGGATTMWCGDIRHNHTYDKTVNVLVVNGGTFTYNGGAIGVPYDSGVFVNGGIFDDNTTDINKIKHELLYHSVLDNVTHNGRIPESKWMASPRGETFRREDCDLSSPTWADLYAEYEFVGWENKSENDTDKIVNLYAIWEKR